MSEQQDWTDVEVFADRLQAAGDPRGELLAIEMAAERASSSADARRLNREAQRLRDAHHELVWPAALRRTQVAMRGGFAVSIHHRELVDESIPLELLLSARDLSISGQRLEACVRRLEQARSLGLRLEGLGHWLYEAESPTDLSCLRGFIELEARDPALEWIAFADRVTNPGVLAGLPKLSSCSFAAPLREAELRSLGSLSLQRLRLVGPVVASMLAGLFGDTLESLEVRDCEGPLAPLGGIASLRSLSLWGDRPTPPLAELSQLESLSVSRLDEAGLQVLAQLHLRTLAISRMPVELVTRLPLLRELESLSIHDVEGGPLDLSLLAELPRLRRLVLPRDLTGSLTLPPGFEWLAVSDASGPVAIHGEVAELGVFDCDPRHLPSSLLEHVRKLRFVWSEDDYEHALAELPRLTPRLERLELYNHRDEWSWPDAPAVLGAWPQLRALEWPGKNMQALAERARMLPDLCLLGPDWPHGSGATT